jgi:two-component sensor histidine kinase
VKYGSLSGSDGGVIISWTSAPGDAPTFVFRWREHGGPGVVVPTRQGFGSRVIKEFLASDFGGAVALDYHPDGVTCELVAPMSNLPTQ